MPEVVGENLDVALSDIERSGFEDEVEILGGGLFGVVVESNWVVCEQSPAAGQSLSDVQLTVDRTCGDAENPSEQPSDSGPAESDSDVPLTVTNNADLAALLSLTDYCAPAVASFAKKYSGRVIEFDGSIGALNNHESYDTRYDILVGAGDFSETSSVGPAFQFRDVGMVDLNLRGKVPDAIGAGDNLHVVAEVDEYEKRSCLFLLEPVRTKVR